MLAFAALPASAQVFKCTEGGVTTYSQHPCGAQPKAVDIRVHQPDAREQAMARQRAAVDRRDASVLDASKAAAAARADAEDRARTRQQQGEQYAKQQRCNELARTQQDAAVWRDTFSSGALKEREEARRKHAEERHFFECYAK